MDNTNNLEKKIKDNISLRSIEGKADKKIWRDYKAAGVFIIAAVFILIIGKNFISSYRISELMYYFSFCVIFIIITFIFLREVDMAVNNYVKRKYEFYHLIYAALIEKYGFTDYELSDIIVKTKILKDNNKLKSAYFIPFGMYVPPTLTSYFVFIVFSMGFGYRPGEIETIVYLIIPLLIIFVFIFCLVIPLKKRVAVWYRINNDESMIIDEISSILMQKNIIEQPLKLEVKKFFKNSYFLILILEMITVAGYIVADSNLATQEKQYLKMVYPVEDKLLEILGY